MKPGIAVGASLTALAISFPAAAQTVCDRTLTVSWEPWPPYQISREDTSPTGIDIELIKAIADEVGCEVEFVKLPWKRQLRQIKKGKVDLTAAANYTKERDKFAHYSEPYLDFESILWVNSADSTQYTSLKHFLENGKRLGVTQGWTYGEKADDLIASEEYGKQIDENSKVKLNIRMTGAKRVDGTLGNRYTVAYSAKENGVRDKIRRTDVVVQSSPIHIIFSEQTVSEETVDTWNSAIEKLREEGKIRELTQQFAS